MKVQTAYKEPVSFNFGEYEVVVQWNDLLLGYDAEIWKVKGRGKWLVTKTGGKSVEQASISARQIILGKTNTDLVNSLDY